MIECGPLLLVYDWKPVQFWLEWLTRHPLQYSVHWPRGPWSSTCVRLTSPKRTSCVLVESQNCMCGQWSRVGGWMFRRANVRKRACFTVEWATGKTGFPLHSWSEFTWICSTWSNTFYLWVYGNAELYKRLRLPVNY